MFRGGWWTEVHDRRRSDVGSGDVSGAASIAAAVRQVDAGGPSVEGANLRRLCGLKRVPCDTILRRRLENPISPVQLRKAFQKVLQRALCTARQGAVADDVVARALSGGRGRHRHVFLPPGSRSALPAAAASRWFDQLFPSVVVCSDGSSRSSADAADGGGGD